MLEYQSTTTLNAIRSAQPCQEGWEKLLKGLGKTRADDEPLPLTRVLEINGLDDTLWVLSNAPALARLARHTQAAFADRVLYIFEAERPGDMRVRDQIAMLRNDTATDAERAAAGDAARSAAGDAARSAAGDAARSAAWDDAWHAAGDAALAAAWDAERAEQERILRDMLAQEAA